MKLPINHESYEIYVKDHYKSFPSGRIKPASYESYVKIRKLAQNG